MSSFVRSMDRLRRRHESGFTLVELLISISILGLIGGVLGTAFVVSYRGAEKVKQALPSANSANNLNLWLSSDISSASTISPDTTTWLNNNPALASTSCSVTPAGSSNVLQIKSRNPNNPADTYVTSYRYEAPSGSSVTGHLWRTFCRTGAAPLANSILVEDIDPTMTPAATYPPGSKNFVSMDFRIISRSVVRPISVRAAIRSVESAPSIVTVTTSTIPLVPACNFSAGSIGGGVKSASGNKPLDAAVPVTVLSNMALGGGCTKIVTKLPSTGDEECVLALVGVDTWGTSCYGAATFPNSPPSPQPVDVFDRVDDGDAAVHPTIPPTDIRLPGGTPFVFTISSPTSTSTTTTTVAPIGPAGFGLTATSVTTPCAAPSANRTCITPGVGTGGSYTAKIQIVNSADSPFANPGAAVTLTLTASGGSFTSPATTPVTLTILPGQAASSTAFTFKRPAGGALQTVTATGTVGTSTFTLLIQVPK